VGKLKETEAALKRSLDEKGLTLRQSASDQEVISFLDSRTQVRGEHREWSTLVGSHQARVEFNIPPRGFGGRKATISPGPKVNGVIVRRLSE